MSGGGDGWDHSAYPPGGVEGTQRGGLLRCGDLADLGPPAPDAGRDASCGAQSVCGPSGGREEFGQLLLAQPHERGWERARDKEVAGGGASWVWNLAQEHFYDACQTVDWYHAMEHRSDVPELLHGEGTSAAKRWYRPAETALYNVMQSGLRWRSQTLRTGAQSR
jgi:hypothetical protein